MEYVDECGNLGNIELLNNKVVTFMAEPTTPESEWVKVEQWLHGEILGTNVPVMSTFQSPFEMRVLQLLFEHNHPTIFYTSEQFYQALPAEYKISPKTPQLLALFQYKEYVPTTVPDAYDLAIMNIADEVVTVGAFPDSPLYKLAEAFCKQSDKPYRALSRFIFSWV